MIIIQCKLDSLFAYKKHGRDHWIEVSLSNSFSEMKGGSKIFLVAVWGLRSSSLNQNLYVDSIRSSFSGSNITNLLNIQKPWIRRFYRWNHCLIPYFFCWLTTRRCIYLHFPGVIFNQSPWQTVPDEGRAENLVGLGAWV